MFLRWQIPAFLLLLTKSLASGTVESANETHFQKISQQLREGDQAGRFVELLPVAEKLSQEAFNSGSSRYSSYADYFTCRAYFALHQYNRSLSSGLRGVRRSVSGQYWQGAWLNSFCVARVYGMLGAKDKRLHSVQDALEYGLRSRQKRLSETRMLLGYSYAVSGDPASAEQQYRLAMEEAETLSDVAPLAAAHDILGFHLYSQKKFEQAETHVIEAFRLRKMLVKRQVGLSYRRLGLLRLEQKRPKEALRFFDLAVENAGPDLQMHRLHLERAKALRAVQDSVHALQSLHEAVKVLRAQRMSFPFSDDLQISSELVVQDIYSGIVDLAAELYLKTKNPDYATEAFQAAQENRAASLRVRIGSNEIWRQRLSPRYWELLSSLRNQELRLMHAKNAEAPPSIVSIRRELDELESAAGMDTMAPLAMTGSLEGLNNALNNDEVLIAFHIGQERCYRWVISRKGRQLQQLAGRKQIEKLLRDFKAGTAGSAPYSESVAVQLYQMLFAGIESPSNALWTLIPDEILFDVPFAALHTGRGFLIEEHAIRLAPNAFLHGKEAPAGQNSLLAAGDPISNRADPRWNATLSKWQRWLTMRQVSHRDLELPRLVGSLQEIERCTRKWNMGPSYLLQGPELLAAPADARFRSPLYVAHFATHVFQPENLIRSPIISLGLADDGEFRTLAESDIAAISPAPRIVTLSGCGSGQGRMAPGQALLGLTRAWLMAGTRAVVASLWTVSDSSGELFEEYYAQLQKIQPADDFMKSAQALQKAQLRMIRKGGNEAQAIHWASYFVIGAI